MKVLIACEFSGIVRDAFIKRGHDASSLDLLPTELKGPHIQGDIFNWLPNTFWDLIIVHPPCTYLAVCGNRYYAGTDKRIRAIDWTMDLWERILQSSTMACMENPVGVLSTAFRPPDQYIQPWQFGHGETKKTGLWLYNLPKLVPTNIVEGRETRIWYMSPSPDRGKERSRFYPGIAEAMATQWGQLHGS